MYHIDLSLVSAPLSDNDDLNIRESEYDNIYQNLIISKICDHRAHLSGCLACGADINNFLPIDNRSFLEAECKGILGLHYCICAENENITLKKNDQIVVQFEDSLEIAKITEVGDIVKLKRRQLGLFGEEVPRILRKVSAEDEEKIQKNRVDEERAKPIFIEKVAKFSLNMKLVDIHYQFDRKKLFFFYTADGRVDFRELAKELAAEFKTRIELRQIGVRDEAKRIGGIGTCGREYCCATFLSSFKRITTQIATEQNVASNMSKLSGPCGKLKCCLSYEFESE